MPICDASSAGVRPLGSAEHLRSELTVDALMTAVTRRRPQRMVLHHTNRGSQYTASDDRALLTTHGITASMSRSGDCYDNAMVERFFATLKTELIDRQAWPTRRHARQAIFEWIEDFYHRQRLHSALGYLSPIDVEEDTRHVSMVA